MLAVSSSAGGAVDENASSPQPGKTGGPLSWLIDANHLRLDPLRQSAFTRGRSPFVLEVAERACGGSLPQVPHGATVSGTASAPARAATVRNPCLAEASAYDSAAPPHVVGTASAPDTDTDQTARPDDTPRRRRTRPNSRNKASAAGWALKATQLRSAAACSRDSFSTRHRHGPNRTTGRYPAPAPHPSELPQQSLRWGLGNRQERLCHNGAVENGLSVRKALDLDGLEMQIMF